MASRGASRNGRGGYRAPKTPAAASGPGAMSQRTDGGAGQPIRPMPATGPGGGGYGARQASVQQQQAAPLRAGGPATPQGQPAPQGGPPLAPVDFYGPTQRPNEPITSGAQMGPGLAPDPGSVLRDQVVAFYRADGNPFWLEILEEIDDAQ